MKTVKFADGDALLRGKQFGGTILMDGWKTILFRKICFGQYFGPKDSLVTQIDARDAENPKASQIQAGVFRKLCFGPKFDLKASFFMKIGASHGELHEES